MHDVEYIYNSAFFLFRTATARGKAEQADLAALQARNDGQSAVKSAHLYQEEIESATPAPDPNTLRPEPMFQGMLIV